eukprot:1922634-Prorocentrum_lima.AAC.1
MTKESLGECENVSDMGGIGQLEDQDCGLVAPEEPKEEAASRMCLLRSKPLKIVIFPMLMLLQPL